MAGMLAARVLSDIFERVIVLERDTLHEGPQLRPGVPQARHLHALLPRGRRILEKNFPGIRALEQRCLRHWILHVESLCASRIYVTNAMTQSRGYRIVTAFCDIFQFNQGAVPKG
jgi:hypothetical protein